MKRNGSKSNKQGNYKALTCFSDSSCDLTSTSSSFLKNRVVLLMAVKEEGRRAASIAAEAHPRALEVDVEVELEVEEELVPTNASLCGTYGNSPVSWGYIEECHTQNT